MKISDIRIKLLPEGGEGDRLRAFCSITFADAFVIHDLKIIEGTQGIFVAMPSRRVSERCGRCDQKNYNQARFCNSCGTALRVKTSESRLHGFVDIAHPINSDFRRLLHECVVDAYRRECDIQSKDETMDAEASRADRSEANRDDETESQRRKQAPRPPDGCPDQGHPDQGHSNPKHHDRKAARRLPALDSGELPSSGARSDELDAGSFGVSL
ncbi:MAG: SpoVG family protein [Planctomycetota bacterium]